MNRRRITAMTILAITVLILASSPSAQEKKEQTRVEPPRLIALLFYADWCKSCKVLEPKLNEVKAQFQGQPVLFTRFDLTDDFTKEQSARFAALTGLESFYQENEGKTGFLLLIDGQSRKLLGKITKEKTADEIKSMLTHALKGHPVSD